MSRQKSVMAGLGQFEPCRFITNISSKSKKKSLFHELHSLNQYFTSYDVFLFSHMAVIGNCVLCERFIYSLYKNLRHVRRPFIS